jgi:hypothetical protein
VGDESSSCRSLIKAAHLERLNLGKLLNTVAGTPVGEAARSIHVGAASVIVADLGCEKFENAFHRFRREGREYCGELFGRTFCAVFGILVPLHVRPITRLSGAAPTLRF